MIEFHCVDCNRKVRHPHRCPAKNPSLHRRIAALFIAPFLIAAALITAVGAVLGFWDIPK